ncbi:LysR substrate-binding domain-containing protein [Marinomonas sp. 15G1-11]|uniref:LysR substrate-binding domain-containing protein n=1 Tax=Marinomonas phaeophyticola TaxID=3004091 RepID=A0ABT4JY73_9GAMM|nr:LysR substrate-binding domain-containing protein [Marinomonas sp. 15G1-11]MCZ2723354.1 LysR substrate-binding domain-containing protein [Marinomonas sp. 15G1-11]
MNTSLLTLESLLVLDAIERRGSFAAAAEQLNKVPSALSYIVQKLEEQLGVTLFVRQGRRSVLTPAGQHLLEEGRKVLTAVSKITEQTQTIAHGWEPKIRIAIDSILDNEKIFNVMADFLYEHPSIEIDIKEEVMNGTWEALIKDEVDLVIGAPEPIPSQQGLRAVKIDTLDLLLVVKANHPLLQYEQPLNKSDLRQFRTVVVHDSVKGEIPRSSNLIEESQHFFVSSVNQKIEAVLAGIGIGFLPKNRIQPYLDKQLFIHLDFPEAVKKCDLFMAWKTVNHGKGLQNLRSRLEKAYLET